MGRKSFLLGIFMFLISGISFSQNTPTGNELKNLILVPWPAEIAAIEGTFAPQKAFELVVLKGGEPATEVAKTLVEDLSALGFEASVKTAEKAPTGSISLSIEPDESLGKEGYKMTVNGGCIAITANTESGLFWGTRTALQLLAGGPSKSIPNLKITDKPQYPHRGLLLDPARSFHTMDFILDTVKNISAYKMNYLQFHFTDNEGYRLPSDKFPNLPSIGANGERLHYSKEEIAKLVVYAKKYHVLIQPEIEMPGHAGAISSALPQTRCSIAKGACAELCIGSDESCKAMQAIIEEVMGMFPGPYWHLGGDEANHGLWQGCAACQKRIKDADLKDTVGLYNDFVNRMNTFVKSKGRRMMIWEGFRPDSKPTVDKDIIVFPYDINLREGARPMDYLDAGYTVVNASWKPLYLVWHMHVPEPEALAKWDACQFKSYHDDGKYGVYPMTEPWIVKQTPQLLGGQLHSLENHQNVLPGWLFGTGPYVENQRKWQPAPRIQIVAERLWTGTKTTPEDLLRRAGVKEK